MEISATIIFYVYLPFLVETVQPAANIIKPFKGSELFDFVKQSCLIIKDIY